MTKYKTKSVREKLLKDAQNEKERRALWETFLKQKTTMEITRKTLLEIKKLRKRWRLESHDAVLEHLIVSCGLHDEEVGSIVRQTIQYKETHTNDKLQKIHKDSG